MDNKYWQSFTETGSIYDYLNYVDNEKKAETQNANEDKRFDNKRTDNRGE